MQLVKKDSMLLGCFVNLTYSLKDARTVFVNKIVYIYFVHWEIRCNIKASSSLKSNMFTFIQLRLCYGFVIIYQFIYTIFPHFSCRQIITLDVTLLNLLDTLCHLVVCYICNRIGICSLPQGHQLSSRK